MKKIPSFNQFLTKISINETIRAEDAYRDLNAVQTVIDNKRDLGFITLIGSTLPSEEFWEMIDDNNLKTMKVKGNDYQAYIYYRPNAEKKAKELQSIAQKYGGYLAWDATEEDSRRIGELLGYDKKDIDAYINKNYKK
jgi:hypothetical protein